MLRNALASDHVRSLEVTNRFEDIGAFGQEAHCLLGEVLLGHVIAEEAAKAYLAHLGGMCSSSLRGHVFFGRDKDLDAFVLEEVVYRIDEDVFVFCSTWVPSAAALSNRLAAFSKILLPLFCPAPASND